LSEWEHSKEAYVVYLSFFKNSHYDVFSSLRNPKELFNLHHSLACNVVERIFGILKRRFRILQHPPEYDMGIQALILPALAALHNFIRIYDPGDIEGDVDEPHVGFITDNPWVRVLNTAPMTREPISSAVTGIHRTCSLWISLQCDNKP